MILGQQRLATMYAAVLWVVVPAAPSAGAAQTSAAGNYRIAVCKIDPCSVDDTTNVIVRGVVVLSDTTFSLRGVADSAKRWMSGGASRGHRNACFALENRRAVTRTYAGVGGVSLTSWADSAGGISLNLYEGVDAWHRARLMASGDAFRGIGRSSGTGGAAAEYLPDIVVGRRTGPIDATPCLIAAAVKGKSYGPDPPMLRVGRTLRVDTARAYVLYFWNGLLDSAPPPQLGSRPLWPTGAPKTTATLLAPSMTWTLVPRQYESSRQAYVDTAVARIDQLVDSGIAPWHIVVVGSGRATEIVRAIADRTTHSVAYVFIGPCEGPVAGAVRPTRVVYDLYAAETPVASRCGSRFTSSTPGSGTYVLPTGARTIDDEDSFGWLEPVMQWVAARLGRG